MSDKIYDSEKNVGDEYTLKTLDHSSPGSVHPVGEAEKQDAVFGTIHPDGPDYRAVGWMGTAVLMMKTQVGLGVLSIPAALQTLGMVPGVICLMVIAIMTTWSDYVVGTFKRNHPEVYSVDDVGFLFFGRIGREVFAVAFCLFMTAVVGAGILGVSVALNAVSTHGACTAIFVVVAAVIAFGLASIETLGKISWLGWIGMTSILAAILTLTVSVGVQERPALAPQVGNWNKIVYVTNDPTFSDAVSAISGLVFAFAGTPAFFGIVSEMKDPKMYTRSMLVCQGLVTVVYLAIGIVVYYFCGQYVASPALGSAGVTMKKICYGLALPGLCVTICIYTHLPAKYLFVRFLRGSPHLTSNTFKHWAVWLSCTGGCAAFSYLIASAVPVFGGLVGLIGALFGTLLSMQVMGGMWLYDNWARRHSDKSLSYRLLVAWNMAIIVVGTFLMVSGTYGSIDGIIASYRSVGGSRPWTCADNSGSV